MSGAAADHCAETIAAKLDHNREKSAIRCRHGPLGNKARRRYIDSLTLEFPRFIFHQFATHLEIIELNPSLTGAKPHAPACQPAVAPFQNLLAVQRNFNETAFA